MSQVPELDGSRIRRGPYPRRVAKPEWASGEPQYSIWTGVRLGGRTRHRVITYRCTRCGFLEAYANPDASD